MIQANTPEPDMSHGCLHHYRVLVADGTVILALPEWVQLPDGRKLKAEPMWAEVAA